MVEITENTKDLVTSCMIQRLSTNEALDYLKENKIDISERTYTIFKADYTKMKFEGLTPHSSVGVQTKLMTCLIYQNKSVSKHTWNDKRG